MDWNKRHNLYAKITFNENGTVTITRLGPENTYLDRTQPFVILVSKKDLSNQTAADQGGPEYRVEPPGGLANIPNATVLVQAAGAGACPGLVEVIARFDDEPQYIGSSDRNPFCCGGVLYDPAIQGCCKDQLYYFTASVCCGNVLYDNHTTACCGSTTYNYTGQGCCKDTVYDAEKDYCCNNRIATDNCDSGIGEINVTDLRMTRTGTGTPALAGRIRNLGTITYTSVNITVECLDAEGTVVDTFPVRITSAEQGGLLPGGSMIVFGNVYGGGTWEFLIPARDRAVKTLRVTDVEAFYSRGSTGTSFGTGARSSSVHG